MAKIRRFEQYQDFLARIFPEYNNGKSGAEKVLTRSVTFQVTDACNLCCSYCYQINKGRRKMPLETAKKFIDLLLSGEKGMKDYINPENSPGIVLDFIGGEPFLEIDLIDQIVDYFERRAIELMPPWAEKYMISICSNGVLYFNPEVQKFLHKHRHHMSFSVTIDGNRELHDSCRVFPDGSGSYDLAVAAAKDWMDKGGYMGSKITIAPGNVQYLYEALVHMIEMGYQDINANCVYEEGWEVGHARELYRQMKKTSDYFLEKNIDFSDFFCSLYEQNFFRPKTETDNDNWCGGTGLMISLDPDGYIYPCIRYMESSLGTDQPPVRIGSVTEGVGCREEHKCTISCLQCITRRSQSTDECFYCPIAEGCSWCSAYNYQVYGTPDARATYICVMHKARALANVYFWNKYFQAHGERCYMKNNVPDEWALEIVSDEELKMLKELSMPKEEGYYEVNSQR